MHASSTWARSATRRDTSTTGRAGLSPVSWSDASRSSRCALPCPGRWPCAGPAEASYTFATVSRVRRMAEPVRARPGLAAIACLGIAWGFVMHSMGWAQLAHFAQVRALADGQANIDRWHWQTKDKAWADGHFYSVKAPGLPLLTLPEYMALDAAGAWSVSTGRGRHRKPRRAPAVDAARALLPVRHAVRLRPPAGAARRDPGRGRDADGVGAHAARGGDPRRQSCCSSCAGQATESSRATERRRRSRSAWERS